MTRAPASIPTPRAVLFDAYGTLFDVYSVARGAEAIFPGSGERLAALWRDKQIDYTRLVSMSGSAGEHYLPFWELTRAGLRHAARRLALDLDRAAEDSLMNEYRQLAAFPDSRGVLAALQSRGIRAGILSNGDPDMLAAAVASAGLDGLLDPVISVQPLRKYKTDPACYALGTQALQLSANEIVFVSSNGWDAIGATWFGYTTLWVNRADAPPDELGTAPTRTGTCLADVLDFFPLPEDRTRHP